MTMSRAIEARIAEFLAADDSKLEWVKPAVRQHGFLPLYVGWVAALGLRPDGSLVRWDHEADRASVRPLRDAYWQRMAICQGAKRYPELRALLPKRPASAQTCSACSGSGQVSGAPQIICECGGIGWIIPGEEREPPPG
jgi:hypothetical protein